VPFPLLVVVLEIISDAAMADCRRRLNVVHAKARHKAPLLSENFPCAIAVRPGHFAPEFGDPRKVVQRNLFRAAGAVLIPNAFVRIVSCVS
jgi:hypothetical protein